MNERDRQAGQEDEVATAPQPPAQEQTADDNGAGDMLPLHVPGPNDVLDAVLELSRTVAVDMHADEVVHTYVDAFKNLFPDRLFCVRLFAPETGELSMVYATGRLLTDRRDVIEITQEALDRHSIEFAESDAIEIQVCENYVPVFQEGAHGFDVPMMDGGELAGIVSVEYQEQLSAPEDDRALIVQLAMQLSGALRNSRLHRESVYYRDYLSKLLDHANAPIMVMDKSGEVTLVNRDFLAVTSFKRDEVEGKDWFSLLTESQRRRLLPIYINALRGEPTSNLEVKLPRRDGSVAQMAVNAASILSPDGDVEGVIYIFRDITEIRELEEQIIHAEKLATLGQLAAGVVHELNNPLTSISVYGEHLLKQAEKNAADPRDVEKLRRIVSSADRILKFTRDLVTYARPSTERPVSIDVHEIVDQALTFCEHLLDETGAAVEKRYEEALRPVYGIKGQLVQVLVNLVTNACHAMPMGAGKLVIHTLSHGDNKLKIRITDSGRGIPEDNLSRVFEPFFTTKGEGKGTGLGLSIVRNIIEQHRGEITVQSEAGFGTTFEIVLACRADPHDTNPPAAPTGRP